MVFCILLSEINNITFQICEFIILNWEYDADEQKIMTVYDGIRLDSSYKENGEWRIADTWACSMDIYEQQPFLKVNLILNVLRHEFTICKFGPPWLLRENV